MPFGSICQNVIITDCCFAAMLKSPCPNLINIIIEVSLIFMSFVGHNYLKYIKLKSQIYSICITYLLHDCENTAYKIWMNFEQNLKEMLASI